jgi:hypothetical protein
MFLHLQNFKSITLALDMQTLSKGKEHLSITIQSCKKEFDFVLKIIIREKSNVSNMKKSVEQMKLFVIKRKHLHNLLIMNKSIIMEASCTSNDIVKVRLAFMNFLNHIKFLM